MFTGFSKKGKMRFIKALIIFVALTFAGSLVYTGIRPSGRGGEGRAEAIAIVNGEKIERATFERMYRDVLLSERNRVGRVLPEMYGPLRAMVLDRLVDSTLLLEEAREERVRVTSKEINARFEKEKANFPSGKEFEAALEASGLTVSSLKGLIKQQLLVENLVEKVRSRVKVSQEDVKKAYEEKYKKPASGPEFEKAKPGVESGLLAEARSKAVEAWFSKLKDKAKIEIFDLEIRAVKEMGKGNVDKAIALFGEALKSEPDNPHLYVGLGVAHARKKDMEACVVNFKKAVDLSPDDPYMRLLLGDAYRQQGKKEEAIGQYRRASELGYGDLLLHLRLQSLFKAMGLNADAKVEEGRVKDIQKLMEARNEGVNHGK